MGCAQHPRVNELTELENQYLECFFRYLFETTTAGYVLYGEKPFLLCSFMAIEKTIPGSIEHKDALIFTQGLQAWKKLNIQSNNYLLVSFSNNESVFSNVIIFVNKKAFKDVVKKNLPLFQFKLGPEVNEQNLLSNLLSPDGFTTMLKGHEALQGILFGYGVGNSLTYERGNALRKKALNARTVNPPFQHIHESTTPDQLKQEIVSYVDSGESYGQNVLNELADFSFYISDEKEEIIPKIPFSYHTKSEESKKLLDAYAESEKTVLYLRAQNNFLEKTLERLRQ